MSYQENIFDLFKKVHQRDKDQYIKDWMVNWTYQDVRTKRNVKYEEGLPEDFYEYNGPGDIVNWMNWQNVEKPDYFNQEQVNDLIEKSRTFDQKVYEKHGLELSLEFYDQCVARNNAQDYVLANFYQMLGPISGQRVMDFGAGYGRQANLWSQNGDEDQLFIGVDAIPKSYCLQHMYYSCTDKKLHDYAVSPDSFKITDDSKGIYHLPTWRLDLVPDNYLDKIVTIQVFPELNEKLVKYAISQFHRILKPSGMLLLRDHMSSWRPGHKMDTDKHLTDNGFTLEFKPHIRDRKDLHGIPRIYRKTNQEILEQEQPNREERMMETKIMIESVIGQKNMKRIKSLLKK